MNFSKLYECWHFAEILAHSNKVELHKVIHSNISAMIPSPSRGEEKCDDDINDIMQFHNYMKKILWDNKKSSTMIKELVEEINRLKEA